MTWEQNRTTNLGNTRIQASLVYCLYAASVVLTRLVLSLFIVLGCSPRSSLSSRIAELDGSEKRWAEIDRQERLAGDYHLLFTSCKTCRSACGFGVTHLDDDDWEICGYVMVHWSRL